MFLKSKALDKSTSVVYKCYFSWGELDPESLGAVTMPLTSITPQKYTTRASFIFVSLPFTLDISYVGASTGMWKLFLHFSAPSILEPIW